MNSSQDDFYNKLKFDLDNFFATATKEEIQKSMEGIDFDSLDKLNFLVCDGLNLSNVVK
jgi:hypothetical protein